MWRSKSNFAGGQNNGDDQPDGYGIGGGQQQYEATTGGKKRGSSRLKKSSGSKDEAAADDDSRYNNSNNTNYNSNGGGKGDYNGGGTNHYNGGGVVVGTPYIGSGYGHSSSYGGGYGSGGAPYGTGAGDGGGYAPPYNNNAPAGYFAHQDGTRSPLYINTREVHVYGAPPGYDNDNSDDRRRSGGFFGPAFHAVGNFFDRRFGLNDRS